jgi:NAD+ diphosphatase
MFIIDFRSGLHPGLDDLIVPLFGDHQMLVSEAPDSWGSIPRFERIKRVLDIGDREFVYLGKKSTDGVERTVWAVVLNDEDVAAVPESKNTGMSFRGLRSVMQHVDFELASVLFRAMHISRWRAGYKFCPGCGTSLDDSRDEMARICPACGITRYPVISPAIIVAITRGKDLLLCRAKNNPNAWHSLVAGYMEAGERAEDTVAREVLEEVGLKVRDIRYWGSQPWPFSGSLMLGFRAEYESGEIVAEPSEIDSAAWFPVDALPELPPPPSIAHRIIVDTRRILLSE